uniref:Uncharacterized protein n=1 Tax=Knipowitschia caucasica TaxID=637954 RepID=A0AAV2KU15_KNICA
MGQQQQSQQQGFGVTMMTMMMKMMEEEVVVVVTVRRREELRQQHVSVLLQTQDAGRGHFMLPSALPSGDKSCSSDPRLYNQAQQPIRERARGVGPIGGRREQRGRGQPADPVTMEASAPVLGKGKTKGTASITANGITANGITANGITANDITANDITANGIANGTANGTANTSTNAKGLANGPANGPSSITANGTPNITANGPTSITAKGTANITANGTAHSETNGVTNGSVDGAGPEGARAEGAESGECDDGSAPAPPLQAQYKMIHQAFIDKWKQTDDSMCRHSMSFHLHHALQKDFFASYLYLLEKTPLVKLFPVTCEYIKGEKQFYHRAHTFYEDVEPSEEGMLGDFVEISEVDLEQSRRFLSHLIGPGKAGTSRALDCGAGIGRVSKGVLFPVFEVVELADMMEHFLLHAHEEYLGDYADRVETYFCYSLQDFTPTKDKYDVIWMQWVAFVGHMTDRDLANFLTNVLVLVVGHLTDLANFLVLVVGHLTDLDNFLVLVVGHLTDRDLANFLVKCKRALRPNGVIVLKDNMARQGCKLDPVDSSISRHLDVIRHIVKHAGLSVVALERQEGFPEVIMPVWMLALRLEAEHQEAEHQEAEHQEAEHQEVEHQEAEHQEAEHQEAEHQEAEHQEAEHQEAEHQEAEHQEAEHQEAEHQEAEHQEAEHQEAEHQEAEHQEAEHQEAEHQEAEHQETEHQEAEHQEAECNQLSGRPDIQSV